MNYFEIMNKCLVELGYKQVNVFAELTKNDHLKLKNIINIINNTICRYDNWYFLMRKKQLQLESGNTEIPNTIDGRIIKVMIDNQEYDYLINYEDFIGRTIPEKCFTVCGDKLIFPEFKNEKTISITYYTKNTAISADGTEKSRLEAETDTSLIPMPFVEPLLVYGSCMRLKANPQHVKFSYWYGMYKEALSDMRAQISISAKEMPLIKMHRK